MENLYTAIDIEGWKVSNPFRILTSKSVYDIEDTDNYDTEIEKLSEEQNALLSKLGYEYCDREYLVKFGRIDDYEVISIDEAIQRLAIKDGVDLVEFENGNIGFVAYYHGFNENYFEVINTEHYSGHTEVWKNHIVAYEDGLYWLYIIENESEVESAVDLIEWSIGAWYNTEEYPDYEQLCIGDVIEEQLEDKCIKYKYIDIWHY